MASSSKGSSSTFFDDLKAWSEIKLRILTKYFDAYHRIRGSANSKIYYVDGFAGTGWYGEDASGGKEGSPVRLAKLAQEIATAGKAYRLICLNYERDLGNFEKLNSMLSRFDPQFVRCHYGPFEQHIPDILKTTGSSPCVFFLDPFGPSPLKLAMLQPLLRRRDTELLLNLNTPSLRRMAGFEDSNNKQRDAKLRLVSDVLGEDSANPSPQWLQEWHRINDPIEWEHWAATAYSQRLLSQSVELKYALPYPIRETFRSNPKYYLVFATRSSKAIPIMNDLICTEEDDLFTRTEASIKGGQMTLFGPMRDLEREAELAELINEIHAYGLAHQGCTRLDIIDHFIIDNFGQFKQKHYRQAISKLVADGRAEFANGRQNDNDPVTFS